MKSEFEIAITQLSSDRNLSPEVILEAIEAAIVSAYKRNYGSGQNASVTINPRTGQAQVFVKKMVVEEVADQNVEIPLAEARTYAPDAEIGGFIDIEVKPRNFGRIAAQTAKQVITQRIREAERDSVYLEYAERVGEIINGIVRNVDSRSRNVMLSLGKAEAILPRNEQIPREHYRFNQRLRVYVMDVDRNRHGPQITVSRTHPDLLRRLLELEVPEIFNGAVEIKAIAREPGFRSKIAAAAMQAGVDPVGSCVGMRGVRIRNIVNELNGEKIDVVAWSPDVGMFIANALSPAKVVAVHLNQMEKTAKVVVPDRALSLAIGKEGQNARLAAKLTGWRVDIRSETEAAEDAQRLAEEMEEAERRAQEMEEARRAAAELLAEAQAALAIEEAELVESEPVSLEVTEEEVVSKEPAELPGPLDQEIEEPQDVAQPIELEPSEGEEGLALQEAEEETVSAEELVSTEEGVSEEEKELETEAIADVEPEMIPEDDQESIAGEWVEDEEFEGETDAERRKKKDRGRRLEYDERLGRVVSRKRRKPGRQRDAWQEDDDWDEE